MEGSRVVRSILTCLLHHALVLRRHPLNLLIVRNGLRVGRGLASSQDGVFLGASDRLVFTYDLAVVADLRVVSFLTVVATVISLNACFLVHLRLYVEL